MQKPRFGTFYACAEGRSLVKSVSQVRVPQRTAEEIMDAPVQVQERIVEVVNVLPQERVSKRVEEEIVEVPRVVQQERVSERVAVTIPVDAPAPYSADAAANERVHSS